MTTPATPTREVISFGPFSLGRMPSRTKHAGFLHFGGTAVAPNEVIGKSDLINQVWPALPWRKAASAFTSRTFGRCLATERTASATSRRHRGAATALWRRFCGANNVRENQLQKLPAPCRALCHHCRVRRRPTTLAVAIEHRLTAEILSSTH